MSVVRATAPPSNVRATARNAAEAAWSRRHEPRAQWLAALTIAFVAACAAFGHVVEDYLTGDPIVRWDVDFARWLHEHSSPILVDIFKVLTLAGNAIVLALLTLVAVALLARRRAFEQALLVVVVAVGIELLNAGLKLLFHRPRPELAFVHLDTYSFPSGHAATAVVLYGALAILLAERASSRLRAAGWLAGAAMLALAIGTSRVLLNVHFVSDVAAGFAAGLAWLCCCAIVRDVLRGQASAGLEAHS